MGKKYIIELLDDCQSEFKGIMVFGLTQEKQISVELIPEESLRPYTEPDMEQVRKEAYQQGYEQGYTDAYNEPGKGQIHVGDEVTPRETEYDDMIVTRLWKDDYDSDCIDAIGFDGRIGSFLVSRVSKTGKHYEIAAVLEKMKGKE